MSTHYRNYAPKISQPASLPFLEAACRQFNQRINRQDEKSLVAFYNRHRLLVNRLAPMSKAEKHYVRLLAHRHQASQLYTQLE
jgi:hypothetical protein